MPVSSHLEAASDKFHHDCLMSANAGDLSNHQALFADIGKTKNMSTKYYQVDSSVKTRSCDLL